MQRIWWLVAAVALACCPRGGTTPQPDPDGTMEGAPLLSFGGRRELEHRGRLRPARGDGVDWVRVVAPPGLVVGFAVTLFAKDGPMITLDAYDADGRLLARPNRDVHGREQQLVIEGLAPVSALYLRMTSDDRGEGVSYLVRIREVTPDVCNHAEPYEEDPSCCGIWKRCLGPGGFCTARVMDPKFPVRLDLGRNGGLFGARSGDPDFVPTGFLVSAAARTPIVLEALHDDRSTWRIDAVRDDVHDPLIHFERAEIYPPLFCRRQN